jgi:oligopeptide/dipeptide ABC transporter ATP-binding protein
MTPILSVRDLRTVVHTRDGGDIPIVNGVSFDIARGETVGLVGESGSGKSMSVLSVLGLLPSPPAEVVGGQVLFDGMDLLTATEEQRRAVRGAGIGIVYQDPMTSLNPLMRIGDQIGEVLLAHGVSRPAARDRTHEVLAEVGLPRPERAARAFPHQFSGGMRQRVVIAMALALKPKILIADEPTTALDVTIQQQIVALVQRLQQEMGMAVLWITHDLALVARVASRLMVMYGGHLVEYGPVRGVFRAPEHPYAASLIGAIPPAGGRERKPLVQIPGSPPDPANLPGGCPFHPRCPQAEAICETEMPAMTKRPVGAAACWVPRERWVA